jgi:hypothetical protein
MTFSAALDKRRSAKRGVANRRIWIDWRAAGGITIASDDCKDQHTNKRYPVRDSSHKHVTVLTIGLLNRGLQLLDSFHGGRVRR